MAAFYGARTGRWALAGAAAGGAAATRSAGIVLLLPLAIWWWQAAPRRPRDAAWLLLVPLGIAAYAGYLGLAEGDALRFLDVQEAWSRHFAGPFVGAWDGLRAAVDGVRQLGSGQRTRVYFEEAGGDPYRVAALNIMLFGFLVFAVVAAVGVWRRLPQAYAVYVVAALALPLSFPVGPQPLMSLPRFLAVLFPVFMWLAVVCEERRLTEASAGGVRHRPRSLHRPVRHLALHRVRPARRPAGRPGHAGGAAAARPAIAGGARAAAGFEVDEERAAAGFGAEIAYYLEHHLEGADAASLDDLRDRCAEALRAGLDLPGLDHATAREAMLASLEFRLFPEVPGALEELRAAGCRLVAVSNWDCSLPEWLAPTGVLGLLDGVVSSAEVGAAKPDPAPFRRGLELAGVRGGRGAARGRLARERRGGRAGGRGAGRARWRGTGRRRRGWSRWPRSPRWPPYSECRWKPWPLPPRPTPRSFRRGPRRAGRRGTPGWASWWRSRPRWWRWASWPP